MNNRKKHICPVERAGSLDNKFRKWIQNPQKILDPFIVEGMTVLDIGCGPGFFSISMAKMVGKSGRAIASDLQEGMLQKVSDKVIGTELEQRIKLHKCEANKIGVSEPVDFILLFYMVHEVTKKNELFAEIATILKPDGRVLMVEPSFHVSKSAFEKTIKIARDAGFTDDRGPSMLFGKTVILKKG